MRHIDLDQMGAFVCQLREEERSAGTVEKYQRDVGYYAAWLAERPVSREEASAWREHLVTLGYAPATENTMLAALNRFFQFVGWPECRVKPLRIQRRLFRDQDRELTRQEYDRLVTTAQTQGRERLSLLLETICATGIRVSEVRYITVEAAYAGRAEVRLKGKVRTILIPGKLARKLIKYARKNHTASGEVFLTKGGGSSHQKRDRTFEETDLGGDEEPVQAGGSGRIQGISSQPAAFVRTAVLPGNPGRSPSCRRAGAQLH